MLPTELRWRAAGRLAENDGRPTRVRCHVVDGGGSVAFHDLYAPILHLLGFDHSRVTYRHAARDYRLPNVHGHVVKELCS